jgi:adenylate cyclase
VEHEHIERKLTAILAADVAGYSRLMGADEEGTLRALKAHRKTVIDPKIAEHHGRIVKTTGDGILIDFNSVVDAVRCAVEVQRGMAERNADVPADKRIEFRVGINLGDIIIDGDDIYGDGVNIAARLEGLAVPGGICVSRAVRDDVRDKLGFIFADMGEQSVKNIARPVRVFRLRDETRVAQGGGTRLHGRARRLAALALLAVVGSAGAVGLWVKFEREQAGPYIAARTDRPSIAVLPFANMSGDAGQEYFSDGITEEILTALGRSPYLLVIARNSSFAYKGKAADASEIGKVLGVRYLLEGSVRKAADQVRVTVQLIDARSGAHLWAEKYDRPLKDIFAVQDDITGIIVARLGSSIQKAEVDAGLRKAPADLGAYDYYLRGRAMRQTSAKASTLESRALFEKAIELDANFAPPYAELALTYYSQVSLRWDPPRRAEALIKGLDLAAKAIALDPSLSVAYKTTGDLYLRQHHYDEAAEWARKAIALNQNEPENYAGLANIYSVTGRSRDALPLIEKALVLDPLNPPVYDFYLGRIYLHLREPDRAIPHLRTCARRAPDFWVCHAYLAAAYGQTDANEAAHAALAEMMRYYAVGSIAQYRDASDQKAGPEQDYLVEGLARAGLPPD